MNASSGAAFRGIVPGALVVGAVALLAWNSEARPQQEPPTAEVAAFLEVVDVDGDGVHTHGDRVVMEWWLAHGGNASTAMANASEQGGVEGVRDFLESPAAQLTP